MSEYANSKLQDERFLPDSRFDYDKFVKITDSLTKGFIHMCMYLSNHTISDKFSSCRQRS